VTEVAEGVVSEEARRSSWRAVAIPSEHGGWGLTAEPIALGLLLACSWAGATIGLAALLAFVARTPLKLAWIDHRRGRSLERTRLAWRIGVAETVALVVLAGFSVALAGWTWLVPVAAAVPLVAVELWFDVRSRSRRLMPELCGGVGMAAVVAAIVVAGGGDGRLALAAWVVLAARSLTAIPFVRVQIARLRHGATDRRASDRFQLVGVVAAALAWVVDPTVIGGSLAVGLIAVLQFWWSRRLPVPPVKILGLRQMALGFTIVGATAVSVLVLA